MIAVVVMETDSPVFHQVNPAMFDRPQHTHQVQLLKLDSRSSSLNQQLRQVAIAQHIIHNDSLDSYLSNYSLISLDHEFVAEMTTIQCRTSSGMCNDSLHRLTCFVAFLHR
jgi:hypothetical protein